VEIFGALAEKILPDLDKRELQQATMEKEGVLPDDSPVERPLDYLCWLAKSDAGEIIKFL